MFFLYLVFQSDSILDLIQVSHAPNHKAAPSAVEGEWNARYVAEGRVLIQIWKEAEQLINQKYSLG